MIKPNKYTNIDFSVIGLSYEILKLGKIEKSQKYNQLFEKIVYNNGEQSKENFLLALNFLFLLGKIEYYKKEDAIEFLL